MIRAGILSGILLLVSSFGLASAQEVSPKALQATQTALNNRINDCSQPQLSKHPENAVLCTTPSPTPTETPIPTNTPVPAATAVPTEVPTDTPTPVATQEPCWVRDADLGDPDNDYIVFIDVFDEDGNEYYVPEPCPVEEEGSVASDTPTPTLIPARPATPRPVAAVSPRPQIQIQRVVETVVVVATPTPEDTPRPTSTPTVKPTASPTATVVPTKAPTAEPTEKPTKIPTVIPTPDEKPAVEPSPSPVPQPTGPMPFTDPWVVPVAIVIFILGIAGAVFLLNLFTRK